MPFWARATLPLLAERLLREELLAQGFLQRALWVQDFSQAGLPTPAVLPVAQFSLEARQVRDLGQAALPAMAQW